MVTFAIDIDSTLDIPRGSILFRVPLALSHKAVVGHLTVYTLHWIRMTTYPTGIIDSTQKSAGDVTHLWTPKPIAKGRFLSPVKFWLENSFLFKVSVTFQGRTIKLLNLGVSNPLNR